MKLMERISRFFIGLIAPDNAFDPSVLNGNADHSEKLKAAAEKYGAAFKCGSSIVPREVMVGGKAVTVLPGEKPKATVTPIGAKKVKKS